ncbi:hypothetical protein LINGRAHAP2_LOCUS35945 [Linum grandiflorum]
MTFWELQQRVWSIDISHVYREVNFLADDMKNANHSFLLGIHQFDEHRPAVTHWSAMIA